MKRIESLLMIILSVIVMTGCGTFGKQPPVVVTKHTTIDPPSVLTSNCDIPEPFSKVDYLAADWKTREDMMSTLIINQYSALNKCNNKLSGLRSWIVEQNQIIKK